MHSCFTFLPWKRLLALTFAGAITLSAQTIDYPFRNPQLPDDQRINDLLSRLSIDEKIQLMSDHPSFPRLDLHFTGQVEGLHGLALGGPGNWGPRGLQPLPTTTFPQQKGLGQSWDVELLQEVGALEGYEARYNAQNPTTHFGGLVVRASNADLSRDPRWGRTEESFGEDPLLAGSLAVAFAHGLQGPDPRHWQAASLMKHFLANENENGRSHTSSDFNERLFREYYSVPFRMGFEQGGSRAVMAAYNAWNGTPMMIHPVLRSVMINEWHNDGLICTDGGALKLLITDHKSFPDKEHGAAAAVQAGINHFLDDYISDLRKAADDHLITEAEIDRSLHNLLRLYLHLGELDPAGVDPYATIGRDAAGDLPPVGRESSRALARRASQEGIVLLRNEHQTLPINANKIKTLAVIGPWADQVLLDWYSGTPGYAVSIPAGLQAAAPNLRLLFNDGSDPAQAAEVARHADVVLAVLGNHPTCYAGWDQCPTPSNGKEDVDRKTITLEQETLAQSLFAANPATILVLRSSFPYAIQWSQSHLPAILQMTHGSQEEGNALADVLFGRVSPAGRLTQTWPNSDSQLLPILDYDITHGSTYLYSHHKPLYAFGYGLSYTHFVYQKITANADHVTSTQPIQVHVTLTNAGAMASDEVVQLYVRHLTSKVTRPQIELKAFQRSHIEPGVTKTIDFMVNPRDLAYWDTQNHRWVIEAEQVQLLAGGSSDNLPLAQTVEVTTSSTYQP